MVTRFLSMLLGVFLLMGGITAVDSQGETLDKLQIMSLKGKLLDPAGKEMEEYDYLDQDQTYRFLPETWAELASLDGKKFYQIQGPGVLSINGAGVVTLNGKPMTASNQASGLKGVTAKGGTGSSLGGMAMRGQGPVQVQARTEAGATKDIPLYSGYYALVIGCGAYKQGWPILPNPVKDAKEVADVLKSLGFTVKLLEDPDGVTLSKAFNGLITGPGKEKEKGVVVWFSGHGHTLSEADGGKLGYLIPVDAPDPDTDENGFMEKAVSMRQIETVARRMESKHVLMVFDSCFSGAIFQITRARPSPYIEEKVTKPVRQFITAGDETEKVPDRSVFKTVFLQGIKDGEADRNRDGYVTGQELGAYLQEEVVNYSQKAQHPQFGKINNPKLDKGDFVFVASSPKAQEKAEASAERRETKTVASRGESPKVAERSASGPELAEIRKMLGDWGAAYNRLDLEGLLSYLADNVMIMIKTQSGNAMIPKTKYREVMKERFSRLQDKGFERRIKEFREVNIQGETATVIVRSEFGTPGKQGRDPTQKPGQHLWTEIIDQFKLVKRDGRWLIAEYRFEKP